MADKPVYSERSKELAKELQEKIKNRQGGLLKVPFERVAVTLPPDVVEARRKEDEKRSNMSLADAIAEVKREREARNKRLLGGKVTEIPKHIKKVIKQNRKHARKLRRSAFRDARSFYQDLALVKIRTARELEKEAHQLEVEYSGKGAKWPVKTP